MLQGLHSLLSQGDDIHSGTVTGSPKYLERKRRLKSELDLEGCWCLWSGRGGCRVCGLWLVAGEDEEASQCMLGSFPASELQHVPLFLFSQGMELTSCLGFWMLYTQLWEAPRRRKRLLWMMFSRDRWEFSPKSFLILIWWVFRACQEHVPNF